MIHEHLPKRPESREYSTFDVAYPFIAGLTVGGRGMIAAESLRLNALDQEIFGLEKSLPTEGTVHNAFADMAGLDRRKFDEVYVENGTAHPSMDLLGDLHVRPARRRTVPETAESARTREVLEDFTGAVARRCLATIPHGWVKQDRYTMLFGDATQLEVEGRCFDMAETDRSGARALQWATLMVGPGHRGPVACGRRRVGGGASRGA